MPIRQTLESLLLQLFKRKRAQRRLFIVDAWAPDDDDDDDARAQRAETTNSISLLFFSVFRPYLPKQKKNARWSFCVL